LRELIEAKMKELPVKPRAITEPAPVIDLMAALNAASSTKHLQKARGRRSRRADQGAA
jgi:non-homologous end joining protein Ku